MFITTLSLSNFRNYRELNVTFEREKNLIIGDNAQGKTNLLEAVHILCLSGSQRSVRDVYLIQEGAPFFRIGGAFCDGQQNVIRISLSYSVHDRKQIKINGREVTRAEDHIGQIGTVSLSSEDGRITLGGPYFRRRFIDMLLAQLSKAYVQDLSDYRRGVNQRNRLLKSGVQKVSERELESWDQQLVAMGARIMKRRAEAISALQPHVKSYYGDITGLSEELRLNYDASVPGAGRTDCEHVFSERLSKARKKDRLMGYTTVGPHRDDIQFSIDRRDLRVFGSLGQHRAVVAALKFAEARMLMELKGEPPILLLDDIFTELDRNRAQRLLGCLDEMGQVLITACRGSDVAWTRPDCKILRCHNGEVLSVNETHVHA